jgi:hypothetical protein
MARIPDSELERIEAEVSVEQLVRANGIEAGLGGSSRTNYLDAEGKLLQLGDPMATG